MSSLRTMHTRYATLRWTAGQKIVFRFFCIFLTLQILTENFMGNLFGSTMVIWRLGETIWVRPCLWLNLHLFHFKYIPQTWTSFSGALHTIRDIAYLLLSAIACILWTILDRKRLNYNKLQYWFSQGLIVALSCIAFAYGIIKLFPIQMKTPSPIDLHYTVGDLSPFQLLWTTFGYGKPYQVFSGIFEWSGAILILGRRTRVAGLIILASVMLNVIMLNYTYQVGVLVTAFYILLIILFLLASYARPLSRFFFSGQTASLSRYQYIPAADKTTQRLRLIAVLVLGASFLLNLQGAYDNFTRIERINRSKQYSLVKNYVVNKDTLRLTENDTTCWRLWSERESNGKRFIVIAMMKPGVQKAYGLERDMMQHRLILHPINQPDSALLTFTYADTDRDNWHLQGVGDQKNIRVDLQKMNPATTLTLLKTRRTLITFDDESDNE